MITRHFLFQQKTQNILIITPKFMSILIILRMNINKKTQISGEEILTDKFCFYHRTNFFLL